MKGSISTDQIDRNERGSMGWSKERTSEDGMLCSGRMDDRRFCWSNILL